MNHNRGAINQPIRAALNHIPLMIDPHQITPPDRRKALPESIQPQRRRLDRVPTGNMPGDALVESLGGKDAEGGCQAAFEVVPLLVGVGEFGRRGEAAAEDVRFLAVRLGVFGLLGRGARADGVAGGVEEGLGVGVLVEGHVAVRGCVLVLSVRALPCGMEGQMEECGCSNHEPAAACILYVSWCNTYP